MLGRIVGRGGGGRRGEEGRGGVGWGGSWNGNILMGWFVGYGGTETGSS